MTVVVLVIDGFGVGAMADVGSVRPEDTGANTALRVFKDNPSLLLPNLERLGLVNAIYASHTLSCGDDAKGEELPLEATNSMVLSDKAMFGIINLAHDGADTYWGHQEIMGSVIKAPSKQYFHGIIDCVEETLNAAGYATTRFYGDGYQGEAGSNPVLVVNNSIVIGDNMETDEGLNHNITASLDEVSFDDVKGVAGVVRRLSNATRVIAFGGINVSIDRILNAYQSSNNTAGISAPLSGVYEEGYQVVHLGYAIDTVKQLPALLSAKGVATHLIGKVADIVVNDGAGSTSINTVDTRECIMQTVSAIRQSKGSVSGCFICTNIQETDLAGHRQDSANYASKLMIVDEHIPEVIDVLSAGDILIITADHGNDPFKGSKHTREQTPLLVYVKDRSPKGKGGVDLGERKTLSDIAATVSDAFNATLPEAGESFLKIIYKHS